VDDIAGTHAIPDDLAEDLADLVQIGRFPLGRGDIHDRPHELDPTRLISNGASHNVRGLDRAIGHQELMFELPVRPVA
jgi:hypothetical protein